MLFISAVTVQETDFETIAGKTTGTAGPEAEGVCLNRVSAAHLS